MGSLACVQAAGIPPIWVPLGAISPEEPSIEGWFMASGSRRSNKSYSQRIDRKARRQAARRHILLEKLEPRQVMAAGPQLIAVQPDQIGLELSNGAIRNQSPRELLFRFNDQQQIDPATLSGIRLTRGGTDGLLGTGDDVVIQPGFIGVNAAPATNEVVMRFSESLPDDQYRIDVFGFDDPSRGVVGVRNLGANGSRGDLLQPSIPGTRQDSINFRLDLGAQILSVVPQPVYRNASGQLQQKRDEIILYFNDDDLFVERDAGGNPTRRSAENPDFYQLILTRDSVGRTDDQFFRPRQVIYDAATDTARLVFPDDLGVLAGGEGTFRLRVGTRFNEIDYRIAPTRSAGGATAVSDLATNGLANLRLTSRVTGENGGGIVVQFANTGTAGLQLSYNSATKRGTINFGGATVSFTQLRDAINAASSPLAAVLVASLEPGSNGTTTVPLASISALPAMSIVGLGSSLDTATDLGTVGSNSRSLSSFIIGDEIRSDLYAVDLPGSNDDFGQRDIPESIGDGFVQHIDERFGADSRPGVTTIFYNFRSVYTTGPNGESLINAITERQRQRMREALDLWSQYVGVQFIETQNSGFTIALGDTTDTFEGDPAVTRLVPNNDMAIRVDPTLNNPLLVLNASRFWQNNYGEDLFRYAIAGIGFILGLERANELPSSTIAALNQDFLDNRSTLEAIFPGGYDRQHAQYLHRPESRDIDLYRFSVNFNSPDKFGSLNAETFAERLTNGSPLDTTLTLYRQFQATAESNLNADDSLRVRFDAVAPGLQGNRARLVFNKSSRGASGAPLILEVTANQILVNINSDRTVTAQQLIDTLNNTPASRAIVRTSLVAGSGGVNIASSTINYSPIELQGGRVEQIARNDDYFSKDSMIDVRLGSGTYYLGVAASGNDRYDPTITDTGWGGRTEGRYEIKVTFRSEINQQDVIRDRDSGVAGVPGTPIDGDGDGVPGGANDFWFQVKPLQRRMQVTGSVTDGQIVTITGFNGETRRFEFDTGNGVGLGNIAVAVAAGAEAPAIATALGAAINGQAALGVSATVNSSTLTFNGERTISLSPGLNTIAIRGRTLFVDKSAGPQADGSLARPFNNIAAAGVANAFGSAQQGDIVRIVGNGGGDGNITTVRDNFAYEIGVGPVAGQVLEDGATMELPKGVTVMIDGGSIFKFNRSRIGVGSSTASIDRSGSALQVLGSPILTTYTPDSTVPTGFRLVPIRTSSNTNAAGRVYMTSWLDETIGRDRYAPTTNPGPGDWGGMTFRREFDKANGRPDLEDQGIFLQYVNGADIRFGGGSLTIDSRQQVVNPIQVADYRPTITNNFITRTADAAISATPNSFEVTTFNEPRFQASPFTSEFIRVGPEVHGNTLVNNSINGLFVKAEPTVSGEPAAITTTARFDDVDIVHVITEDLTLESTAGGMIRRSDGSLAGRLDAGLIIDPGTIVKLEGARIELRQGTQLLAEGVAGQPIIFTSLLDDRYGTGGTLDTKNDGRTTSPRPRDWGGLYAGPTSQLSLDSATVAYGGGVTKIGGTFRAFNAVELQQAQGRITNSTFESNADGVGGQGPATRLGRLDNDRATIFVRGSQPVIANNTFRSGDAVPILIDANSFSGDRLSDLGRQTGFLGQIANTEANYGPLFRSNRLDNNEINGLVIRGAELTTESVWDDTDIVHVLFGQIIVGNLEHQGGLRLQSRVDESLVVKFFGQGSNFVHEAGAGITATGTPTGIADRIGGTVQVIGQPGFPVVLTSLRDDSVGAGQRPDGRAQTDTNNDGVGTIPRPGDWRSILLDQYANDRNVDFAIEQERQVAGVSPATNNTINSAQDLGDIAAREADGDETNRIGFEVEGAIASPFDVDFYSFTALGGTQIWLDVDRTNNSLDTVVEVLDSDGNVLARSNDSLVESNNPRLSLSQGGFSPEASRPVAARPGAYWRRSVGGGYKDDFSINTRDAGLRVRLPGSAANRSIYHFRVRSAGLNINDDQGGLTTGSYRVQLRVREDQQFTGSIIRYADIRYATNGIHVRGLPGHSPLLGEAQENEEVGNTSPNQFDDRYGANGLPDSGRSPGLFEPFLAQDEPDDRFAGNDRILARDAISDFVLVPNDFLEEHEWRVRADNVTQWQPLNQPQDLGNILLSDRGVVSVGGRLLDVNDVDYYEFSLDYAAGESPDEDRIPVVFDMDYADGLTRPDTTLVLFDELGKLIFWHGYGVHYVADDQNSSFGLTPGEALGHGSFGTRDPYLRLNLPRGRYFVGVIADGRAPRIFQQWDLPDANTRREPRIDVERVVEDRIRSGPPTDALDANDIFVAPFQTQPDATPFGQMKWYVTDSLNLEPGHGIPSNPIFDRPGTPLGGNSLTIYNERVAETTDTGDFIIDPTAPNQPRRPNEGELYTPIDSGKGADAGEFDLVSRSFNLSTYEAEDLVNLYFDYRIDRIEDNGQTRYSNASRTQARDLTTSDGIDDQKVTVIVRSSRGETTVAQTGIGLTDTDPSILRLLDGRYDNESGEELAGDLDPIWRQGVVDLSRHVGASNVEIILRYDMSNFRGAKDVVAAHFDNFIVGASRPGEMVSNSPRDDRILGTASRPVGTGYYQMEIRQYEQGNAVTINGAGQVVPASTAGLRTRNANQASIVIPAATSIADGQTITIENGGAAATFEFDFNGSVRPGNRSVAVSPTDDVRRVGAALLAAINADDVRELLGVSAASARGNTTSVDATGQINIFSQVLGVFEPALVTTNNSLIRVIYFRGEGDLNAPREQSQLLLSNNTVTFARDWGIWSQAGERDFDPDQTVPDQAVNPWLQTVPNIGNPHPGAVRNLPNLNQEQIGGIAPGIVIQNNTLDSNGLGGIHVEGQERPLMIVTPPGQFIVDGLTMTISAGRSIFTFEFDDVAGVAVNNGGSGVVGGDGVQQGHIPIYYLRSGMTELSVAHAIRDAIISSPLVTNGTTQWVEATVGQSLLHAIPRAPEPNTPLFFGLDFPTPAVYLTNVTTVVASDRFAKLPTTSPLTIGRLPIAEAPQPFARIVNNTIRGTDGNASEFVGSPLAESNDVLTSAVFTGQGLAANPEVYRANGRIGDGNIPAIPAAGDVDVFQFHMRVGDRVLIDIDTAVVGLDSVLRVFDERGQAQSIRLADGTLTTVVDNAAAPGEAIGADPYVDFTATREGTYYVSVSSKGNETFDLQGLANRIAGSGGTGDYTISIDVIGARQFVISAESGNRYNDGETFTVSQVPEGTNTSREVRFEFDNNGTVAAGNVRVPFDPAWRPQDMARSITDAINSVSGTRLNNRQNLPNGSFPAANPLAPVRARALGGPDGVQAPNNVGLNLFPGRLLLLNPLYVTNGWGVDRPETAPRAMAELFVVVENASSINANGSIVIDPTPGNAIDQLIPETGVLIDRGASPTLLNNVFDNLHAGIVEAEGRYRTPGSAYGLGDPLVRGQNRFYKDGETVVGGSAFQHIEENGRPNFRTLSPIDLGHERTPSNQDSQDFVITIPNGTKLFVDAAGGNFYPAPNAPVIDSAIDSVQERVGMEIIKQSVSIAPSPIIAPTRDGRGILRADDPSVAPPNGQGANIFKDRGARDRADFVGPSARLIQPVDNVAQSDRDPNVSVVQLREGVLTAFQLQLTDGFEPGEALPGIGVDDDSVVGSNDSRRRPGAVITLFENGKLLREGFDYSFQYNADNNTITLTPTRGAWANDRVYEIAVNNKNRFVVRLPSGEQIRDGQQILVTDSRGGQTTFEFDSGYVLQMPTPIEVGVPLAGGGFDGVADGDQIIITDASGNIVNFELDLNGLVLPGRTPVPFTARSTQQDIVNAIRAAIDAALIAEDLVDVATANPGSGRIVIGGNRNTTVRLISNRLTTNVESLSFQVPAPASFADGQIFTISDGVRSVTFEFDNNDVSAPTNQAININGILTSDRIAAAVAGAINRSGLRASASSQGAIVGLGLIRTGSVTANTSPMTLVAASRALRDGQTFAITDATVTTTFEFDYDNITDPANRRISIGLGDTVEQLAAKTADAIRAAFPALAAQTLFGSYSGGIVAIGGTTATSIDVPAGVPLSVIGQPNATASTSIEQFGDALLVMPTTGGQSIQDGSSITLTSNGRLVRFEFDLNATDEDPADGSTLRLVRINASNDAAAVADALVTAINGSSLGIFASRTNGSVNIGRIGQDAIQISAGNGVTLARTLPTDGEQITIRHNGQTVTFEFDNSDLAPGVLGGNTAVRFQGSSSNDQIAAVFAAAIQSSALALGATALPTGIVRLSDNSETVIDLSRAPSFRTAGSPGGATPVPFIPSPAFTVDDLRRSLIDAINGRDDTTLFASYRGGDTVFIENAIAVNTDLETFYLRAVQDQAENTLNPNRADESTRFTILMPNTSVDFGDAADPITLTPGRYPSRFTSDGARHAIIPNGPRLGALVDGDPDAQIGSNATGDDNDVDIAPGSPLAVTRDPVLGATILTVPANPASIADGAQLTVNTGTRILTFEFDRDGRFSEGPTPVDLIGTTASADVALRLAAAMRSTSIGLPVQVDGTRVLLVDDDEDGVRFGGFGNPSGAFGPEIPTPVTITVAGEGIVDAWVDFNSDGDWDDPDEKVISGVLFRNGGTRTFTIQFPDSTPAPVGRVNSYARVRVSTAGSAGPSGLAVDGEVEDYVVTLVEGAPIAVDDAYSVNEDRTLTVSNPSQGLLANDQRAYPSNLTVFDFDPTTPAIDPATRPANGTVTINADGTFVYVPNADFDRTDTFTYYVFDGAAASLQPATVTINVIPENDRPRPVNDTYTVPQGYRITVAAPGVLANDFDPDGPSVRVRVGTPPTRGTLTLNPDGSFRYLHNQITSFAADSFTYIVSDGLLEATATVTLNIGPPPPPTHQNPRNPLDVDNNGFVTPFDALLIINHLNRGLPTDTRLLEDPPPFLDTDGNRFVEPRDALLVINFLNRGGRGGGGEGEGSLQSSSRLVDPRLGVGVAWAAATQPTAEQLPVSTSRPATGVENGLRVSGPASPARPVDGRTAVGLDDILREIEEDRIRRLLVKDRAGVARNASIDQALTGLFDD
jgi:hypothetical protein